MADVMYLVVTRKRSITTVQVPLKASAKRGNGPVADLSEIPEGYHWTGVGHRSIDVAEQVMHRLAELQNFTIEG